MKCVMVMVIVEDLHDITTLSLEDIGDGAIMSVHDGNDHTTYGIYVAPRIFGCSTGDSFADDCPC